MICAFAFCGKDFDIAIKLMRWIVWLSEFVPKYDLLLVAAADISDEQVSEMSALAKMAFKSIHAIRQVGHDPGTWPTGPNQMFGMTYEWCKRSNQPFLWLEPDAIPLVSSWFDNIQAEYIRAGKPFMGTTYDKPWRHMNGVAVYPPNIEKYNPQMITGPTVPFDVVAPEKTLRHAHITRLIQRSLSVPESNIPHRFDTPESMGVIRPEVVLFHGCKDGSLIDYKSKITWTPSTAHSGIQNITVWSTVWSDNQDLCRRTIRVLRYCYRTFGVQRVLLFSCIPLPVVPDFPLDVIQIPKLDANSWNIFVNRIVPLAITSDYAMSVHEDGFPIRPELWSDRFLAYDYIGAPWTDGVVGNGGFNIESKRLLKAKMNLPLDTIPAKPSDWFVCRVHRARLEQEGITFAPKDIALDFSNETTERDHKSFGFHSRKYNQANYNLGWNIIDKSESKSDINVTLVYIYVPGPEYRKYAESFVQSYKRFPPGITHDTVVICQGCDPGMDVKRLFENLPNLSFYKHDNVGHDIGAYISFSKSCDADMMVCVGTSTFFQRQGWLARMVQAWRKHGPGLYGSNATYEVCPHLNTTGFWCPPKLLAGYSKNVCTRRERYDFEHGPNAFWKEVEKSGVLVKLVTWCGEYDWREWRKPANIFRRGDQSNCLTFWHHHINYNRASQGDKVIMERSADTIIDPLFLERARAPQNQNGESLLFKLFGNTKMSILKQRSEALFLKTLGSK